MSKNPPSSDTPNRIQLQAFWPYKVSVLAREIRKNTILVLKQHHENLVDAPQNLTPLNLSQWRVLAALGDQDGRSAAEVVAMTPMDKGIVSRACASLVQDGYVQKQANRADKRVSALYLTSTGRDAYHAIAKALQDSFNDLSPTIPTPQFLQQVDQYLDALTRKDKP